MLRHRHRVPLVTTSIAVAAAVLLLRWAAHSATTPKTRTVTETTAQPIHLMLKPEGGLSFDVRDAKTGDPIPCKLTLVGVDGTPDPEFTRIDIGRQEGDGADRLQPHHVADRHRRRARAARHLRRHRQPRARVGDRRRPQAEDHAQGRVRGGAPRARGRHDGWLSADFHVHAAPSPDSRVPMHDRIYEFVADGVEMIVSTDHNVVSDYDPIIRELDAGRYIASAVGDELTTGGWGHFGAFPLPRDLERRRPGRGAGARAQPRRLLQGRARQRARRDHRRAPPAHRRRDRLLRPRPLRRALRSRRRAPASPATSTRVEVLNGYQDPVRRSVDRVIDDWFALLNHGHLVTATGNSDTHHLTYNIGGYPRNYVHVQDDRPQSVDAKQVATAVRNHHASSRPRRSCASAWAPARSATWCRRRAARRSPTSRCRPRPGCRSIA